MPFISTVYLLIMILEESSNIRLICNSNAPWSLEEEITHLLILTPSMPDPPFKWRALHLQANSETSLSWPPPVFLEIPNRANTPPPPSPLEQYKINHYGFACYQQIHFKKNHKIKGNDPSDTQYWINIIFHDMESKTITSVVAT